MANIEMNIYTKKLVEIAKRIASSHPRLSKELSAAALKLADSGLALTVTNYSNLLLEAAEAGDEKKMVSLVKELSSLV